MNCIFDIGNTRTKIALFNGTDLVSTLVLTDQDEIMEAITQLDFEKSIVSSVADDDLTKFVISSVKTPIVLDHNTPLPIKNNYSTPTTLGKDRLANAVGAYRLFNNSNTIIVDGGTCLKIDFINQWNEYIGGIISPGLSMRFKAVHTFTDKLPLVSIDELEPLSLGIDTKTSIHTGCYTGMNREIEATINNFKEEYDDLKIIITGGDMEELQKMGFSQKNSIFADRWLTLSGLNEILRYNA